MLKRNKTSLLAAALVLVISAAVAVAQPSAAPPDPNLPDANFSSIQFAADDVAMESRYVQFVGVTDVELGGNNEDSDGNSIGDGYKARADLCSSEFPDRQGVHVCTFDEMIDSYELDNAAVQSQTGYAWVNNGPPAFDEVVSNDCRGWTSSSSEDYGSFWFFDRQTSFMGNCEQLYFPVACCA